MICFGPVPSRRLGKSLGVNNIIAPKTCSYRCVYCQVGPTMKESIKRDIHFKPDVILDNVKHHISLLNKNNYPDYITLVSNGEPTLDIHLGETISLLKLTGFPVAVITNASLLTDDSVREHLSLADWVSLKIDAANKDVWKTINRPHKNLDFDRYIESILLFAHNFKGSLHTESMIIQGINDTDEHIPLLAGTVKKINPNIAYLSVPVRPPCETWVKPPDTKRLNIVWQTFTQNNITTELLTGFEGSDTGFTGNIYEDILNITAVHPLREDSMRSLLEKDNAEFQVVESLLKQKLIKSTTYKGKKYFIREYHIKS